MSRLEVSGGIRSRLAATVAALRRPASYPGEEGPVEAVETHMAWVFLTATHAYKLKKPLRTGLIDWTTADARRTSCEGELALNRRLAAPVYRAVVPVARTGGGLRVGGEGPAVDWLVKMRRLPRVRMLDVCIARGTVPGPAVRQLAARLAAFYQRARPVGWSAARYRGRLASNIRAKGAVLECPHYGLDASLSRAVGAALLRWMHAHASLLGGRAARVVDAHGDLRPEHVCLTVPPMVIDCLEFNRSLRLHDPVSDLSFLRLECDRLGAPGIGTQVLARYRDATGDTVAPRLIPFYESYHALIRAVIAVWHIDDAQYPDPDVWRRQATTYLRLARARLERMATGPPPDATA
jgi:aminoglycoside phosphotransferase family enzyme